MVICSSPTLNVALPMSDRVVSCFLYEDALTLPAHQMATVFVEAAAPSRVGPAGAPTRP